MKYRTLAVLAAAGALVFSGTAFAALNMNTGDLIEPEPKTKTRILDPNDPRYPQQFEQVRRSDMPRMRSRDIRERKRPRNPREGISRDRKPNVRDDRDRRDSRTPPPNRPNSRDRRPPEFRKQHSR